MGGIAAALHHGVYVPIFSGFFLLFATLFLEIARSFIRKISYDKNCRRYTVLPHIPSELREVVYCVSYREVADTKQRMSTNIKPLCDIFFLVCTIT